LWRVLVVRVVHSRCLASWGEGRRGRGAEEAKGLARSGAVRSVQRQTRPVHGSPYVVPLHASVCLPRANAPASSSARILACCCRDDATRHKWQIHNQHNTKQATGAGRAAKVAEAACTGAGRVAWPELMMIWYSVCLCLAYGSPCQVMPVAQSQPVCLIKVPASHPFFSFLCSKP